jgi:hypothetical protein
VTVCPSQARNCLSNAKRFEVRKDSIEKMGLFSISALLAATAVTTACIIPADTLSNNITTSFGILIQNSAFPVIHDRYMNLDPAGGGDQHLFLDPVGDPTFNLMLSNGILEQDIIHAVIDGEV